MTSSHVRVLLVDDHPAFLEGLALLLSDADDIEVIGRAADGEEACALHAQLEPDVVVMDLHMPGTGGIEATRRITDARPSTAVLVLTMVEDDDSVFAALRAGARGYILKGAGRDDVLRAIAAVQRGEAIFGPGIAQRILGYWANANSAAPPVAFPELTDREREVLELIAQGLNNAEIARRFVLSPKTVRNHISNIFTKLHLADRAQAIVKAREAGMGRRSSPS
jgi:DNA-binding NarL/FixJ family response regulator